MKFLLGNDDGVFAPGLEILHKAISELGAVTVVAPDRDNSAASNSLTLDRPLRIQRQANGFYAVNGTPTDCAHIALTGFLEDRPDMVIAGINSGSNLGDDVIYSGTVAYAMEGRFLGLPAVAISLISENKSFQFYETAAHVARNVIQELIKSALPAKMLLNINIPDVPLAQIKGIQLTRLGHRHMAEPIVKTVDPANKPIYWIGPAGREQDAGVGTDFHAISKGYVSITPLKTDLTDHERFKEVEQFLTVLN
jgi:5'-nucleotidase